jgi:hypothetical protein
MTRKLIITGLALIASCAKPTPPFQDIELNPAEIKVLTLVNKRIDRGGNLGTYEKKFLKDYLPNLYDTPIDQLTFEQKIEITRTAIGLYESDMIKWGILPEPKRAN